jgi:hypothetical protein
MPLVVDNLATLGFIGNDPVFQTMVAPSLTKGQAAIAANFTFVQKFLPSVLSGAGTVRIKLRGPGTGSTVISAIYIGQVATSGNAYDFDGNQVQVLFGSSGSVTLDPGSEISSDNIDFNINGSSAILIAMDVTSGSPYTYGTGFGANYIAYAKSGVSQAATTAKSTAYTSTGSGSGRVNIIDLIQVAT